MRTLAEFGKLTTAEQQLLHQTQFGRMVTIGTGILPRPFVNEDEISKTLGLHQGNPSPLEIDRCRVRAGVLRGLILGDFSDEVGSLDRKGIQICGARISGSNPLEISSCKLEQNLTLINCRFETPLDFFSAEISNLYLDGCLIPGLFADQLCVHGDLSLRSLTALGEIRLMGASVGANLSLKGARVFARSALAIQADRLRAQGDLSLSEAMIDGEICLADALVAGALTLNGARIRVEIGAALNADRMKVGKGIFINGADIVGQIRLPGVEVGGNLECISSNVIARRRWNSLPLDRLCALSLENASVSDSFFLRHKANLQGELNLHGASFGSIVFEPNSWPRGKSILDGCRYGFVHSNSEVTGTERISWLESQKGSELGSNFKPQPWEQCAKMLRENGHGDAARQVLIRKETLQRRSERLRLPLYQRPIRLISDALLRCTISYGYRPLFAVLYLAILAACGTGVFHCAEQHAAMKPNNPFILRSAEWAACHPDYVRQGDGPATRWRTYHASQLECFAEQPEAQGYPKFNAFIYSVDTLVPLVSLEMQEYWVPDSIKPWGTAARWFLWLHIFFGWLLSLLAIAGFSGLIKQDSTS